MPRWKQGFFIYIRSRRHTGSGKLVYYLLEDYEEQGIWETQRRRIEKNNVKNLSPTATTIKPSLYKAFAEVQGFVFKVISLGNF
jgi:hypothetical protein